MKNKTISQLKKLLWTDFSVYIRLRDCLDTTGTHKRGRCCTCRREYPFSKLQAGHFIPGRKNAYLFDPRQVHAQCFGCNIMKGGNWPEYRDFMVKKYGESFVKRIESERHNIVKFTSDWLIEQRNYIKDEISDLLSMEYDIETQDWNVVDKISDSELPF